MQDASWKSNLSSEQQKHGWCHCSYLSQESIWTQILVIPDDDEGEHVEDDAANLEAVLDPEEGEGGEGEEEAAPVDEEQAGEEAPAAEEGGDAPAEDAEGDFPFVLPHYLIVRSL